MKQNINKDYSPTPLHYLVSILQQLSDELLEKDARVGLSSVRIMGVLDTSVPSSQALVAASLHQTQANVSRQLQAMKKQGLVKISKNKKDSRQRDVTLTSKGKHKYDEAEKLLKNQLNSAYKMFSKNQKKDFEDSVSKLASAL